MSAFTPSTLRAFSLLFRFEFHHACGTFLVSCRVCLQLYSFTSKFSKCLFNIDILLCARFIEDHITILLTKLSTLVITYLSLVLQIIFVPDHHKREHILVWWLTLWEELFFPVRNVLEALLACDIVDEAAGIRTAVEGHWEWLKTFLTCCIPYLHVNIFISIELYLLVRKVSTNRILIKWLELSSLIHLNQWCFADRGISDHNHFDWMLGALWRWSILVITNNQSRIIIRGALRLSRCSKVGSSFNHFI